MAGEIKATVDADKLARAMKKHPVRLYHSLKKRLGGARGYLHRWVRREIAGKKFHRAQSQGDRLHSRTGSLRRSFDSVTHGANLKTLRFLTGSVKQDLPYALIQEEGGIIRPKNKKWLTVPLPAALTAAGVLRKPAPQWKDAFFIRTKKGDPMLVQKQGDGIVPLFVLKKEVRIPGRLGFFAAWEKQMPQLVREFSRAIDEALQPERGEK